MSTAYADREGRIPLNLIDLVAMDRQGAGIALGISCGAAIPAKENDAVAEIGAFLRRQDGAQLLFHLFRLFSVRKTQAAADADAVGIADHASGCTVKVTQQQIRRFSTHTGDAEQFLHGTGNLTAVVGKQHLTAQDDIPGLVLVKAAGMNQLLNMRNRSICHAE